MHLRQEDGKTERKLVFLCRAFVILKSATALQRATYGTTVDKWNENTEIPDATLWNSRTTKTAQKPEHVLQPQEKGEHICQ